MENRTLIIKIEETYGSHLVSWEEEGVEYSEEVYRFTNKENSFCGHKIWDIEAIFREIQKGIKAAYAKYADISDVKLKAWNNDYVLMCGDMELLPCYSYKDSRIKELDEFGGVKTVANSPLPQIFVDMRHGRLRAATDILLMPEYFIYKLTGVKARQYRRTGSEAHLRFRPEFEAELGRECNLVIC